MRKLEQWDDLFLNAFQQITPIEMTPFEFSSVPRIVFGRGEFARLGLLMAELGRRPLVVHNSDGLVEHTQANLAECGISASFYRQRGEPVVAQIEDALTLARQSGCDSVIGLGGGSAIDAAKAVAGLIGNGGGPLDYMEVIGRGKKILRPAAPWMAVPTTAGTGAEVTRNAVIGSLQQKFKASIRSPHLLARVALIDARLAVNVPADVTARCGMDALCQLIESHTSTGANPMTDALALRGISLAAGSMLTVYSDGANLDARESMAMAAMLSGMTLTNAGLGAVHGFAAPLGASFPIPHGTACGLLLPPVVQANIAALRGSYDGRLSKYADIGRALTGEHGLGDAAAVDRCVPVISQMVQEMGLPRLGSYGFTRSDVLPMVAQARKSSSMRYNPVILNDDVLSEILQAVI